MATNRICPKAATCGGKRCQCEKNTDQSSVGNENSAIQKADRNVHHNTKMANKMNIQKHFSSSISCFEEIHQQLIQHDQRDIKIYSETKKIHLNKLVPIWTERPITHAYVHR